jgi:tetratricopeptide (TPR) repeat protein
MGAYREAGAAYQSVRRLVAGDPIAEARLMLKLSWSQAWLSRYSPALRWVSRGLKTLEGIEGEDAGRQRAELMVWYARFLQEQGRAKKAIEWCHRTIEEAERTGNRKALADAYRFLDWAHVDLGQHDQAVYSEKALALYEELGDLAGLEAR